MKLKELAAKAGKNLPADKTSREYYMAGKLIAQGFIKELESVLGLKPGYPLDVEVDKRIFGRKFPSDYQVRKAIKAQLGKLIKRCAETRGHWILVQYGNRRDGVYVSSLNGRAHYHFEVAKYSTDVGDAMKLVDFMRRDGFTFRAAQFRGDSPDAVVSFVCSTGPCQKHGNKLQNHHGAYDVQAQTLPLAIVTAALEAKKIIRVKA